MEAAALEPAWSALSLSDLTENEWAGMPWQEHVYSAMLEVAEAAHYTQMDISARRRRVKIAGGHLRAAVEALAGGQLPRQGADSSRLVGDEALWMALQLVAMARREHVAGRHDDRFLAGDLMGAEAWLFNWWWSVGR